MRNSKSRLTAIQVAKLNRPGRYGDGGGLYLQVSRWKTKSWLFRFQHDGKERQMGLGPVGLVSLAGAREGALAARRLLLGGHDPIRVRQAERAKQRLADTKSVTFEYCARAYIADHRSGWRNQKHADQFSSTLETYAFPLMHRLPVSTIDTNLVLQVLQPIWDTKTETANRLRGRIEKILDWARARGYREGENPARWRGHLVQLLPLPRKVAPTKHRPAMPYGEIAAFIQDLREKGGQSALALEFLILTASRTNEVVGARWREMKGDLWTIPPDRMKAGREHHVPLSSRAQAILASIGGEHERDAFVFEGRNKGRPLSNMAMLELLRDMRPDFVVHGFRSTFKDWAAETTAHENIVSEMALAHVVSDKVEEAYRRGVLMQKRQKLMQDWADYCAGDVGANGNVTAFRRKRKAG